MSIKRLIKDVLILVVLIGILSAIAIPMVAAHRRRRYDGDVKSNLKSAAKAQRAYYKNNGTYTAKIDSLPGFNLGDNVTITVEATKTSYTIAGKVTYGCEAKTGVWFIDSTSGDINGTPCH